MNVKNDFSGFVVKNLKVVHQDRVVLKKPQKSEVVGGR
jgi:hypothetical protein